MWTQGILVLFSVRRNLQEVQKKPKGWRQFLVLWHKNTRTGDGGIAIAWNWFRLFTKDSQYIRDPLHKSPSHAKPAFCLPSWQAKLSDKVVPLNSPICQPWKPRNKLISCSLLQANNYISIKILSYSRKAPRVSCWAWLIAIWNWSEVRSLQL